jgi:hypothetical protein
MKKFILVSVLTVIIAGGIFAQEGLIYIKPTFSLGFTTAEFSSDSLNFPMILRLLLHWRLMLIL